MIEKFKEALNRGDKFVALLTDFSKAFHSINHPLPIAKFDNPGVPPLSTKTIFFYLSNPSQRTKTKNSFSKRSNIAHGVPQGSILGPLLFNADMILKTNFSFHMK